MRQAIALRLGQQVAPALGGAPADRNTGRVCREVLRTLTETLGSCAAHHCVDATAFRCVGLDVNANHLRSVESGWVTGRAEPLHLGRTTQVWQIEIRNEAQRLVCVSRLTMAVLPVAART